jgi:hypothetical protein
MKSPSTNRAPIVAIFAIAILVASVFFFRFSLPGFLLQRLIDPLVGMVLVLAASFACGRVVVRDDAGDQLLLGVPLYGLVLSLISIAGFANAAVIGAITIALAIPGLLFLRRLPEPRIPIPHPLLLLPIALAFLAAITPINTPDELTYKLAVPHLYLQFGRMLELPLNSGSYFPSAVYMADLGALVLSGGIAAKLVHFVLYLLTLRVIRRVTQSILPAAILAWTPALAIIAGWAWAEWAMIGFLLLSFVRWQQFLDEGRQADLIVAAAALGVAISSKYTALPWAVVFLALAISRKRDWRAIGTAAILVAITGSFFYLRNLLWTGSPIAPFLLPNAPHISEYRSTLGGWAELIRGYDIFDSAIIDDSLGILLPVAVLLSPLALLWRNRRTIDLFILGIVQFVALVTLAPTSRLMILALVPLTILGATVLERVWESASRAIRIALAATGAIALFGHLVLLAFMFVERWSVIPYLLGTESEAAYLTRTRDFYQPFEWLDEHTPENAKFLLLAENRTYYLDRRALAAGNLDGPRVAAWLARFPTPDAFARELNREGITHVLVHKPWYFAGQAHTHSLADKENVLVVPPATNAMLHAFLGASGIRIYEDPAYAIYALH